MGKFFEALQRHSMQTEKRGSSHKLGHKDWCALLKYDRDSGRIDLANCRVNESESSAQRLVRFGLIHADGRLTAKGFKACEHIERQTVDRRRKRAVPRDRMTARAPIAAPDMAEARKNPVLYVRSSASADETASSRNDAAVPVEQQGRPRVRLVTGAPVGEQPLEAPGNLDCACGTSYSPDLVVLHEPYSVEAEQFRKLRSSIMSPGGHAMPRLVLVTSTEPGEGKTFVAANLAATMAMDLNHHVLLVDCDLRRPMLHKLFDIAAGPGLSDHLSEHRDLGTLIQRVAQPRLSVVTAGSVPLNPAELLTSERMMRFLDEVKNRYSDRFIVLDSPPPTVASEMKILSGLVDGIVLVLREGGPGRKKVQEVVQQLGKKKILGLVGNFTSKMRSDYYYYNRQYQHYRQTPARGRE